MKTLTYATEKIELDKLTERERALYDLGYKDGEEAMKDWKESRLATMSLFAILGWLVIMSFVAFNLTLHT